MLGESDAPTTPEEIAWAVRKLLETAARERPLVVVFDDVHWGEQTFLDLVEHVADLARDAPILLLCLARPELLDRRPGWGGGKLNATTVLLEPLDALETDELIEGLLGDEELEAGLAARIRTAAEGNPLFVEEMLAMVRESGEGEVAVPPTIKALLAARLDQLDPGERGVLERGAVEGQLFHAAAVAALTHEPAPVERQLVALVRKELVRPDRPQLPETDAYRFRHLLIRDAAYDGLPKSTRAELHERFARWLQEHGAAIVESDEIVGYHLEQAYRYRTELGPPDQAAAAVAAEAADLLASAGWAARLRGDFRAAAALIGRAVELDTPRRLEFVPELAEVLLDVGGLERAAALVDEAIEQGQAAGEEVTAAVAATWRAVIAGHRGDPTSRFAGTIELAREAAALAGARGDEAAATSMLLVEGQHTFYSGRSRAAEPLLRRAHERALAVGDLVRAREALVWLFAAKSFGAASVTEMTAMLDEVPAVLGPVLERSPLHYMHGSLIAAYSGRFDEGRAACAAGRQLADEFGVRVHGAGMSMFAGDIELVAGDPESAERVLRDGFDRLGALGETGFRSTVGTLLAEALVRLGRDDEALLVLDAVESLAQADDVDPQVRLRAVRAVVLARRGESAEAERLARSAVEIAHTTDYLMLNADAAAMLAEVLRAGGDEAGATAALQEALEYYERKECLPEAERTRTLLAPAAPA
jgi:tetratricopeptide (TPR) repeat protein